MRAFLAVLLVLSFSLRALADGAFPDSNQLAAPAGSKRLVLSTTFGLIVSDDDGATWFWICEEAIGPNVMQYQVGAAPTYVMYALDADEKVSISKDGGRSWEQRTNGLLSSGFVSDLFPDPTQPSRAVAIYVPLSTDGAPPAPQIIETTDSGESFHVLYTAPTGSRLESLEIAASAPNTLYAVYTTRDGNGWIPTLVHTTDGTQWDTTPMDAVLGKAVARIAAVDRDDPTTLYLRVVNAQPGKDALAVVRQSGADVKMPLVIDGAMSTFLERANGTLLVGSKEAGAWTSSDGNTFETWAGAPHLRALAERDGVLFSAADNFKDGFAVGRSADGAAWTKVMKWVDMCGVYPSEQLKEKCNLPWTLIADAFAVESAPACPKPDAGQPQPQPDPGGCHCATTPAALLLPLALFVRRRGKR